MEKKYCRILSWVILICICLSLLPNGAIPVEAASAGLSLAQLRQKFPHGKYWNGGNANSYTSSPCNHHGSCSYNGSCGCNSFLGLSIQCMGYAEKLGYDATGYNPRNNTNGWYTYTSSSALDNLKPGDIVRYKNNGHSIYVIGVNGETVTYTDCNSDGHCIIRWDATISKSTLKSSFTHVRSAPSSVSSGSTHTVDSSYGTNFTAYPKAKITAENIFNENHGQISSSSWIGTSDKCTIHEVYTDGCCKVTYPLDAGGTKTVYSKISLFNIQANITPKIAYWISYDKMGDRITSAKQGDWVYLCFRMYDENSGSNLNDVAPNRDYSVTETIYRPDGTVAHTYTYSKSDNNWIGARCYTAGTYSYKVAISGEWGGTFTGTFVVQENPKKINVSNNNVNLTLGGQATSTIKVWSTGYYDGSTTLYFSRSNSNISCSWGDWEDGKAPLTITANAVGTTTLTIGVKDSDSGTVLDTTTVTITVTCSSHSYYYSVTTKPTTSSTGKLTGTCSKCSGATTITLPKLNTTDYSYAVKTAATCTAAGTGRYTWKTTTYGSFYFDVAISAKGHSYTNKVTVPTCTAQGYTTHTCSCGYSYKDTYTSATGHSYSYKATKAPTTSATGTLTGTCSKCKGTTTVTLPKLNSTDYSYAVKTAATCTAAGIGRYTWKTTTYGSFYFDVAIAAKGHSYTNKVTAPTCTAQGYTTHTCSCGYSYKDTYTNATGHSYSYKVTKAPTTSATGTLTGTCTKCSETAMVTLPKLNASDYSYSVKTEPTYTATGIGRYTWNTTAYGSFSFDVTLDKLETAGQIVVQNGSAAPGESVTVTIALKNNPGIASLKLRVSYGNILTLTNISYNTAIGGMSQQPQTMTSPVILNWFNGVADSTGDWTFATLTFVVSENAEAGDIADITICYNADDVYNIADQNVTFAVVNGTIEVADYLPGDINADGTVNNRDLTRLFQYLSDWNVEVNEPALDVNGDGSINNRDLTRLFQYLSDWNVEIH